MSGSTIQTFDPNVFRSWIKSNAVITGPDDSPTNGDSRRSLDDNTVSIGASTWSPDSYVLNPNIRRMMNRNVNILTIQRR